MATSLLQNLITDLQCLPGVGNKTAQRMAYHLLQRKRNQGQRLADTLAKAMTDIGLCNQCRNYTEHELCNICDSQKRQQTDLLCVVETPADLLAVESSGQYQGHYYVLHGVLSPIDGIGPSDIGLFELEALLGKGQYREVILALNPTVEGEATCHFINEIAKDAGVDVSRIAHGIPVGGELDMVDSSTLSHALMGRKRL